MEALSVPLSPQTEWYSNDERGGEEGEYVPLSPQTEWYSNWRGRRRWKRSVPLSPQTEWYSNSCCKQSAPARVPLSPQTEWYSNFFPAQRDLVVVPLSPQTEWYSNKGGEMEEVSRVPLSPQTEWYSNRFCGKMLKLPHCFRFKSAIMRSTTSRSAGLGGSFSIARGFWSSAKECSAPPKGSVLPRGTNPAVGAVGGRPGALELRNRFAAAVRALRREPQAPRRFVRKSRMKSPNPFPVCQKASAAPLRRPRVNYSAPFAFRASGE